MLRLNRAAEAPEAPETGSVMIERAIKVVVDALKDRGLGKEYLVLVGGGTLSESTASAIGADVYCPDATVAEKTIRALTVKQ